jgi:hypothetical protein
VAAPGALGGGAGSGVRGGRAASGARGGVERSSSAGRRRGSLGAQAGAWLWFGRTLKKKRRTPGKIRNKG